MMRKLMLVICGALLQTAAAAQTAGLLDGVLAARQVSYAQAAAVILPAAGLLPPEAGEDAAFEKARPWLPRRAAAGAPITMGELSHLVIRAFGLSGGFMYALFPGPRYAYRALAWRRALPPRPDPGRKLRGEELLYVAGQALSLAGEPEPVWDVPAAAPPPALPALLDAAPAPAPPPREAAPQGQGLSSGAEGVLPYEEEFEIE